MKKINYIQDFNVVKTLDGRYVATGNIFNDTKGRFEDDTYINTSYLKSVDFENGIAITRNSVYNFKSYKE